ncbi:hypothetical protein KCU77_g18128, partial [Aureobasidium melanogenum]
MTAPTGVPNYDEDVDFQALAMTDSDFAKFYDAANGHVDFQDPKALQQLTKSILKRDFDLELDLPDDRLCPPVPVRSLQAGNHWIRYWNWRIMHLQPASLFLTTILEYAWY